MRIITPILTLTLLLGSTFSQADISTRQIESLALGNQQQLNFEQTKRQLALDISQQYNQISQLLQTEITQYNLSVNADDIIEQPKFQGRRLAQADKNIRSARGLDNLDSGLVEIRLADKSMITQWQAGESPLFAYAPDGSDSQWEYIEAFDVQGNQYQLDVYTLPDRPVFIIGLDDHKAFKAGLEVMQATFAQARADLPSTRMNLRSLDVDPQPIVTTVIKQIALQDDKEPWISGKAEVYGIITGIDPDAVEPVLSVVEMPYIDYAETSYNPNQIVIYWQHYRWAAVDMILMEHDSGTNYKEIATQLLNAAQKVLQTIPDPEVQGYSIIPEITNKILSQLPDAWFTNDDDYIDVFYTLQEGMSYADHAGASDNATISLEPLTIQPR
jgi:hypothetical protein